MIAQLDPLYIKLRPTKLFTRLVSYGLFEGRPLTTRGQWINPVVRAHFRLEKRLPQLRQVVRPIFIIGTGRSGTTVLGKVLSMHRDVGFLNEPKALWHEVYPHEDLIGSYSDGHAHYRLDAVDASDVVIRHAHRLLGAYLRAVASRRLVDKYPELVFRVGFVRAIFPDARFIFIVRNGWDTCASIGAWSKRLGRDLDGETHDWWGRGDRKWRFLIDQVVTKDPALEFAADAIRAFTTHEDRAAVEWAVTMREGLRQMETHSDAVACLRFEDLVDRPVEELSRLFSFCRLPEDDKVLTYARAILAPVPAAPRRILPASIAPLFTEMMQALSYEV